MHESGRNYISDKSTFLLNPLIVSFRMMIRREYFFYNRTGYRKKVLAKSFFKIKQEAWNDLTMKARRLLSRRSKRYWSRLTKELLKRGASVMIADIKAPP